MPILHRSSYYLQPESYRYRSAESAPSSVGGVPGTSKFIGEEKRRRKVNGGTKQATHGWGGGIAQSTQSEAPSGSSLLSKQTLPPHTMNKKKGENSKSSEGRIRIIREMLLSEIHQASPGSDSGVEEETPKTRKKTSRIELLKQELDPVIKLLYGLRVQGSSSLERERVKSDIIDQVSRCSGLKADLLTLGAATRTTAAFRKPKHKAFPSKKVTAQRPFKVKSKYGLKLFRGVPKGTAAVKKSPAVRQTKASQLRASRPAPAQEQGSSPTPRGRTPNILQSTSSSAFGSGRATPRSSRTPQPPAATSPDTSRGTPRKPDLKNVTSKIGSKDNITHKPGGGRKQIESQKINLAHVTSKIGSKDNITHKARGGDKKIVNDTSLKWEGKAKVGSLENATHTPRGGDKKIVSQKLEFSSKAQPKIGSKDNITHKPGGGRVEITTEKLKWDGKPKVGSMENKDHKPTGGTVQRRNSGGARIVRAVPKLRNSSTSGTSDSPQVSDAGVQIPLLKCDTIDIADKPICHGTGTFTQNPIESHKVDYKSKVGPKIGSRDNIKHQPGGGQVKIVDEKLSFSEAGQSKVGSLETCDHKPAGGDVLIFDERLKFHEVAGAKVGSLENAQHVPGGGNVQIYSEKLAFDEQAQARINAGKVSAQEMEENQINGNNTDLMV